VRAERIRVEQSFDALRGEALVQQVYFAVQRRVPAGGKGWAGRPSHLDIGDSAVLLPTRMVGRWRPTAKKHAILPLFSNVSNVIEFQVRQPVAVICENIAVLT